MARIKKRVMVITAARVDPGTGRIATPGPLVKAFKLGQALTESGFSDFALRVYVREATPEFMDTAYAVVGGIGSMYNTVIRIRSKKTELNTLNFFAWDAPPQQIQLLVTDTLDTELIDMDGKQYELPPLSVLLYTFDQEIGQTPLSDVQLLSVEMLDLVAD